MSCLRIPLFFGTIKFEHARHQRRREIEGKVPVWRIGSTCIVWWPRRYSRDN